MAESIHNVDIVCEQFYFVFFFILTFHHLILPYKPREHTSTQLFRRTAYNMRMNQTDKQDKQTKK